MCSENNERDCSCLSEILRKILKLQKQDFDNGCQATGCDKPFLGPVCNCICFNTRPVMLFNCCTGNPWTFPCTLNGNAKESNIFRIEKLDDCCATFRILCKDDECNLVGTNECFTIDLNCVGAIKCLADTFIDEC